MAEATATKEEPRVKPRFKASLSYARISPRKLRYVADLIRGKDYNSAVAILRTCSKRGAVYCRKVLDSAMSNATMIISAPDQLRKKRDEYPAEALREIDVDTLHVVEIRVDPGIIMKRWRHSSMRRPTQIRKRFAHLEIILQERELKESKKERSKNKRRAKKSEKKAEKPAGEKKEEKKTARKETGEARKAPKKKTQRKEARGEKKPQKKADKKGGEKKAKKKDPKKKD